MFLDEIDTIWEKGNEHEGLRALLNAGNQRGTTVPRIKGQSMEVVEFEVFCCKLLAGIGALPPTVGDRSISIRMQRKKRTDEIERWRRRKVERAAEPIRDVISSVMVEAVDALTDAEPVLPDALSDRAQDGWEPLLAIADLAGGVWPDRSRQAAVSLAGGRDDDDGSMGHRLLSDCRLVFEVTGADRLKTGDLIEHLAGMEDAPWGEYYGKPVTGRKISTWLKPYGSSRRHPTDSEAICEPTSSTRGLDTSPQRRKVFQVFHLNLGAGLRVVSKCSQTRLGTLQNTPIFRSTMRYGTLGSTSTSQPSEENGSGNAIEPEIASDCDRRPLVADLISEIEAGRDRGDHPGLDPDSWAAFEGRL